MKHELAPTINEEYADVLKRDYEGELFVSKDIIADVNYWVKEKTKGMIPEIADESMRGMLACLINAIAFEAQWWKPYYEEDIWDETFTNADRTRKEVPMLHSQEDSYIEDSRFTGFAKAYEGGRILLHGVAAEEGRGESAP